MGSSNTHALSGAYNVDDVIGINSFIQHTISGAAGATKYHSGANVTFYPSGPEGQQVYVNVMEKANI